MFGRSQHGLISFALSATLFLVVLALLVLLARPGLLRAQAETHAKECRENLNLIYAAKERYAQDHALRDGAPVSLQDLLQDGKMLKQQPLCPAAKRDTYNAGLVGQFPTCSLGGKHALPVLKRTKP